MRRSFAVFGLLVGALFLAACNGDDSTFVLHLTLRQSHTAMTEDGSCHGDGSFGYIDVETEARLESQESDFAVSTTLGSPSMLGDGSCRFLVELVAPEDHGPYILYVGDEPPIHGADWSPKPIDLSKTHSLTVSSADGGRLFIAGDG